MQHYLVAGRFSGDGVEHVLLLRSQHPQCPRIDLPLAPEQGEQIVDLVDDRG